MFRPPSRRLPTCSRELATTRKFNGRFTTSRPDGRQNVAKCSDYSEVCNALP